MEPQRNNSMCEVAASRIAACEMEDDSWQINIMCERTSAWLNIPITRS